MLYIDKLSYSSALRSTSPYVKAVFAVSTLLFCVLLHSYIFSLIVILLMGSLTVFLSGASLTYYVRLLRMPLTFLLLGTVTIVFSFTKDTEVTGILHVMGYTLVVTKAALLYGLNLILTALGAVSCLYFLILSTPFTDLLLVLKAIHCPEIVLELLLLIYRFIFLLYDMGEKLDCAVKSRLGNRSLKTAIPAVAGVFQMLFIGSIRRSLKLYDAMESRCYDGKIQVLTKKYTASVKEISLLVVWEIIMVVIFFR